MVHVLADFIKSKTPNPAMVRATLSIISPPSCDCNKHAVPAFRMLDIDTARRWRLALQMGGRRRSSAMGVNFNQPSPTAPTGGGRRRSGLPPSLADMDAAAAMAAASFATKRDSPAGGRSGEPGEGGLSRSSSGRGSSLGAIGGGGAGTGLGSISEGGGVCTAAAGHACVCMGSNL